MGTKGIKGLQLQEQVSAVDCSLKQKHLDVFKLDSVVWTICSDFYVCSREYSNLHHATQQMLKNSFPPRDIKPSMYLAVENKQSAVAWRLN